MISVRKKIHRIFRKSFSFLEEYPDIRQLALHVTKSHCLVNNDGKTVCLYCTSFQRERIYQVRNHILATHFNQPDHECKLCNKVFIEQFSLNSRKLYMFINTFLLFFIKHTYSKFILWISLFLDMKNVHLKERSYQCGEWCCFFLDFSTSFSSFFLKII